MNPIKLINNKISQWRFRSGYNFASGIMLFNDKENGFDLIREELRKKERFNSFYNGMCKAMFDFKSKCKY